MQTFRKHKEGLILYMRGKMIVTVDKKKENIETSVTDFSDEEGVVMMLETMYTIFEDNIKANKKKTGSSLRHWKILH